MLWAYLDGGDAAIPPDTAADGLPILRQDKRQRGQQENRDNACHKQPSEWSKSAHPPLITLVTPSNNVAAV